ncbi:MAG: PD-(D/E)XK nuclease family protein [Candidatus Margulisbacteria bacterium]|nr:PD-(D/E)XK nuclease family protein [Candidatus Margulisiibacteriota bacterium]
MNTINLLEPYLTKSNILVFQDEQVKKSFIRNLQDKYSFHEIKYLTLEELKGLLYLQGKPVIKGEKRIVALDNALSVDSKKFFNLHEYLDVGVFSAKFFAFFETLQEANTWDLSDSFFESTADSENQMNWQIASYHQLVLAKEQYLSLISKHGYIDEIFFEASTIDTSFLVGYDQVVFIGIDIFSKREKLIIEKIRAEKPVIELASSEVLSFQKNNLQTFSLNRCSDSFGQLVHCASNSDRDSYDVVIDLANNSMSYAELLDLEVFELKYSVYFTSSRVFSVLKNLELLANSWDGNKIDGFRLEEACSNDDFCKYYQISQEDINNLRKRLDNKTIYFSLSDFSLKKVEADILKLNGLNVVDNLVEFIQGLDLGRLLEDSFDTVLDKLFGLLFSLQQAFNSEVNVGKSLQGVGWLKLLLKRCEHLKLDYLTQKSQEKKLRVVDWNKVWFLENKKLVLLNANENVLSIQHQKTYILTEKQLKVLGARTKEDSNRLQKESFLQMCLRNKQVTVYSVESASEGKQTSSFVEELVLGLPTEKVSQNLVGGDSYYGHYLCNMVSNRILPKTEKSEELVGLSVDDFGEAIGLSSTSFDNLLACPLKFYLEKIVKLNRQKIEESIDIKDNILGNFVHDIFAAVCVETKQFIGQDILFSKALEKINTQKIINSILTKNIDNFPKIYHQSYAQQVVVPVLMESIKKFFMDICGKKFGLKDISRFDVEEEAKEGKYLQVDVIKIDGKEIPIKITGRADLRVELLDGRIYIFDFKTGSTMNDQQLSFYSEYYYEGRVGGEELKPHLYFYQVFDMQEKQAKFVDIKSKIALVWADLANKQEYDFAVTTKACKYCEHEGICRKNG